MAKNKSIKAIILNEQIEKLPYSYMCEEKELIISGLIGFLGEKKGSIKRNYAKYGIEVVQQKSASFGINNLKNILGYEIKPQDFRKHIQEIRERAHQGLPKGTGLVANSKGYGLTDDVKVADKYFKGVGTRKQSAQAQHLNYQVIKDEIKRGKK